MPIYLDANATTKLDPRIEEEIGLLGWDLYGNPSSPHTPGRNARTALDEARASITSALGLRDSSLVFTSGATEANNLAVHSLHLTQPIDQKFLVSSIEHPSLLEPMLQLRSAGREVEILPVQNSGQTDLGVLKSRTESQSIGAVAVMAVNNETGTSQPFRQIATYLGTKDIPFLCDLTQAVGKVPVVDSGFGSAMITISSHKLAGPKGVGALILCGQQRLVPQLLGGSQENGMRAGTENAFSAKGFSRAIELRTAEQTSCSERWYRLRAMLWESLKTCYPNVKTNTLLEQSASNTLNVEFPGISAEALLVRLDLEGVYISTGSACASGSAEPSHVLIAMGVSKDRARSSVRFSLCPDTSEKDILDTAQILQRVLPEMKQLHRRR